MPNSQNSLGDRVLCKRGPKDPARYLRGVTLNNGVSATSVSEAGLDRICLHCPLVYFEFIFSDMTTAVAPAGNLRPPSGAAWAVQRRGV